MRVVKEHKIQINNCTPIYACVLSWQPYESSCFTLLIFKTKFVFGVISIRRKNTKKIVKFVRDLR